MWYIITTLVIGGAFTTGFTVVMVKDIRASIKRGFRPDVEDVIMSGISAFNALSSFVLAIYFLV